MNTNIDKKILFSCCISILLALSIFYISLNYNVWSSIWGFLKIPPNVVPFSDFKAHLLFLQCGELGISISQECTLISAGNAKISTHPRIWIYLFDILNLKNTLIYNLSIITLLTLYFYALISFIVNTNHKFTKVFMIVLCFSTSNFIMIERLSTDLIIFLLVYFLLNQKNKILQSFIIFIGFVLKYYPIFLTSLLIEKKRDIFIFVFFVLFFIFFFYYEEIKLANNSIVEMALPIAYGSRTMLKAFFHLSQEYNFFLNNQNINFFRNLVMLMFFAYAFLLIIVGYKEKILININNKIDKFFLSGASIYVGTFIIGANVDYRLMFLILTIPYLMKLELGIFKYLILICYFLSFNSFYSLSGEVLSYSFFIKSALIFFCKFIIFSLLSVLIGLQLKKINFFQL
ncbi:hypothetical protein [Candidatus Pelagibacter sp. Uisw_130]|uniref:hypothetical protein n=1 Tax=Candidatus Pelagibacter sp. Uisw_130 TaxID=3230989 RepID=UPI0039EA855D